MNGRNGHDNLNQALIMLGLLSLSASLVRLSSGLLVLSCCISITVFYRCFSKNVYARNNENRYYLRKSRYLMTKIKQEQSVILDKQHLYFFCPACHRRLRVPKGKGTVKVTCSYCDNIFIKKS